MTINTSGVTYNSGTVNAQTFVGRDQYNYYFVGLAPLVYDPTRRFRNFLNEYLGTTDQPVPFGGRQAQLDELHRWLNDVDAPPYYLMTAEAGRGKSALICRWMEEVRRQRPAVEVIFIPISIRFETAAQDVVFAALAARLAQIYGEPLKPAALSGAQWRGVCESYLDRTPPDGKQLLIILDGLDEATGWHFGPGFFSTNPSPGLRVLVTARLRVGESTPQGWAATLGWQERLTRMATLPPLTRVGVEEALASMGDPLAGLADQVEIVEQLYRLTEGDPLLVRLYVQEFEKQKTTIGTLTSVALQQMRPGLHGYFDQWWKGQKEQWHAQGSDPEKEEGNLRLLLDALSAALGPLTLDDLASLHPALGSSRLIRVLLQSVERWVIGDGKVQGYSYSHSRLGYYFWEQLSKNEQLEWAEQFCAWGQRILDALNSGRLKPTDTPAYVLHHYAAHLQQANAKSERFYALLSSGWQQAWLAIDVTYVGFLNDVMCTWSQAIQAYESKQTEQMVLSITQQVKAALCISSITVLNDMPLELFKQAVAYSFYTPTQALAIAKSIPTQTKKAEALTCIAPYLSKILMSEVLLVCRTILTGTALTFVLLNLADILTDDLLKEVLDIASKVKSATQRVRILKQLTKNLPEPQKKSILRRAFAIITTIPAESSRATALISLIPQIINDSIDEVLLLASSFENVHCRARIFTCLTLQLTDNHQQAALHDALLAATKITSKSAYIRTLAQLAQYLPQDLLLQVWGELNSIGNEFQRAILISRFVPYLPQSSLGEALVTVNEITNGSARANALIGFAPYFPQELQALALRIARAINRKTSRVRALLEIASYLTGSQQDLVREEALLTALSISDPYMRSRAIRNVLIYSPKHQQKTVFYEALASVKQIEDEHSQVDSLKRLINYLPSELVPDALSIIRTIESKMSKALCLTMIISRLPVIQRKAIIEEALVTTKTVGDKSVQTKVLECIGSFQAKIFNSSNQENFTAKQDADLQIQHPINFSFR